MCKALSFVDACTEEHFAAMSRSSPPGFRGGDPRFSFDWGEMNPPQSKVLPPAKRLYAPPGAGGSSTR